MFLEMQMHSHANPIANIAPITHRIIKQNVAWVMYHFQCHRTRLRRVIAALPNNLSRQSARTVLASSPSQGSAARVQGDNNCNDFRRDLYLLDHVCWNECRSACKKGDPVILFFRDLFMIWGLLEASWRHLGSRYQKKSQKVKLGSCGVGVIRGHLFGAKSFFSVFFACQILCLFWASLLGGFRHRSTRILVWSGGPCGNIFQFFWYCCNIS